MSLAATWLIDEQLPIHLYKIFENNGLEAHTAKYAGFSGLSNGVLCEAMYDKGYRWLITDDQTFEKSDGASDPIKRFPLMCIVFLTLTKEDPDFLDQANQALKDSPLIPVAGRSLYHFEPDETESKFFKKAASGLSAAVR